MVVFDCILPREASRAGTDKLHKTCAGDNWYEHSVVNHCGGQSRALKLCKSTEEMGDGTIASLQLSLGLH